MIIKKCRADLAHAACREVGLTRLHLGNMTSISLLAPIQKRKKRGGADISAKKTMKTNVSLHPPVVLSAIPLAASEAVLGE